MERHSVWLLLSGMSVFIDLEKCVWICKCVCVQRSGLGISSPTEDLLSLVHCNLPCSITTPSQGSGIYWAAEEHCGWFHSQCGHVKLTKEQPCWLNNQACYMGPRTGDVGCGAICQDALLCRASWHRCMFALIQSVGTAKIPVSMNEKGYVTLGQLCSAENLNKGVECNVTTVTVLLYYGEKDHSYDIGRRPQRPFPEDCNENRLCYY